MKKGLFYLIVLAVALVFATNPAFAADVDIDGPDVYGLGYVGANAQAGASAKIQNSGNATIGDVTATGGNASVTGSGNSDVDVDNRDTNINMNSDFQSQIQSQSSKQANKQVTVINIEDKYQHASVAAPIPSPDPIAAPSTEFANDVWRLPDVVTMSEAEAIAPNIRSYKWRIKDMMFKRGDPQRVLRKTKPGDTREFMGYLQMTGSTRMLGLHVEHLLYQSAMLGGGVYYKVKDKKGMQKKGGFINGTTGGSLVSSVAGKAFTGGGLFPSISGGRSGEKGKPFLTIEVYR